MDNKKSKLIADVLTYLCLAVGTIAFLFPFLWMFGTAIKTMPEAMTWPPKLLPDKAQFNNFVEIFKGTVLLRSMYNSIVVTLCAIVVNVFLASLAAYGFERMNFPGKKFWFNIVLLTMMVPGALLIIPLFFIVKSLPGTSFGWLDTYPGLILPYAVTGFSIFLFRQFLVSVPRDVDEAAEIDGCSKFQTYRLIIIPMIRPAMGLVAVFTFLLVWNDYLWPLAISRSEDMYTAQIALKFFQGQYTINWPYLMAGATVVAMPSLLFYFFLQRFFQQSLSNLGTGGK
ncbi:carbohydrate ABC transporter permease [Cohnella luojiensis]|uniref:Carbohydrate ABC transporter permease n=1 Tax=Cohnella luojiensis TaxID=652876 RepID=A0A4Y8LS70_9BACL|nr:carbohydrate ABC transporter permease [Cohnella luojiensis]TFE24250.1 carbohydrate ABC transporter permease [Cohnella luojiensis]